MIMKVVGRIIFNIIINNGSNDYTYQDHVVKAQSYTIFTQ